MVAATKEMKWLITGANGQLGSSLRKALGAQGIEHVGFSRTELDISNTVSVQKYFISEKPDVVVNAAAYTNVEQADVDSVTAFRINQLGASNLAKFSKSVGAKFVHFSTDYVFSGEGNTPFKVDDLTGPISSYGKSKLAGELEILNEYSENSLIIRTAWLYSPFGKNFYRTMLMKAMTNNENVRVVCDQYGQPTSAFDLAELTIKSVLSNVPPGIFHGTNSGSCSWFEFAEYIFEISGEDVSRLTPISSSELATKVKRPKYSVLDNQKWLDNGVLPLGPWKESVKNLLPDVTASLVK